MGCCVFKWCTTLSRSVHRVFSVCFVLFYFADADCCCRYSWMCIIRCFKSNQNMPIICVDVWQARDKEHECECEREEWDHTLLIRRYINFWCICFFRVLSSNGRRRRKKHGKNYTKQRNNTRRWNWKIALYH